MAFCFGDGFDSYATMADPIAGYWDSGLGISAPWALVAGRFAGSQACQITGGSAALLVKSSGQNDAVHHIVCAFRQTAVLSGTSLTYYFQLSDGATNQCCIVFRSDGAILLTSATPAGTVLDTYTGAVTAANTWFAFEFEIVINNTTGSWAVRKNGNTVNDRALGSLNTRPGANNYANKLTFGVNVGINAIQLDDLLWRSDASSVAWVGDIRCYTRMPASDAAVQFARAPVTTTVATNTFSTGAISTSTARYSNLTVTYDGTISTARITLSAGYTGNMKCTIFASSGTAPTTVLGSATPISNPATGNNSFTFSVPIAVIRGMELFVGFSSDTSSGTWSLSSGSTGFTSTTSYAAFPVASPTTIITSSVTCQVTITPTNAGLVNEPLQDGTTSYVYSSNPTDADFYTVAPLAGTPAAVIAVVTRGFLEKSDAGARGAAVQIKSGGTTVASTATLLGTNFGWLYRTDVVDPATGVAWTAAGVNNATIGPVVTS